MAARHYSSDEEGQLDRRMSDDGDACDSDDNEEVLEDSFDDEPQYDGDECIRYGSQGPLIDRQFGVQPTLPYGATRHPDTSQTAPLSYDNMLQLCKKTAEPVLPEPIIPILFYGYVQTRKNPEYFYVLPDGLEPTFNELSDKLQQFYDEQQDQPIEESRLSTDLPCVTKYEGDWYRAKVMEVPNNSDDGRVEVFFVDWGNYAKVAPHEIMPLIGEFGAFPPLAFHCREHSNCRAYKEEAINKWISVLKEIDNRVKVEMFTTKEAPYTVELFIHPCARSPLVGLFTPVLSVFPSKPEDITEEKIDVAFQRVLRAIEHAENERQQAYEFENNVEADDPLDLFLGLPKLTDEEFAAQKLLEFEEAQEERKKNRRRQRTGPSRKVQLANERIANLRAQGKGPAEFIDWQAIPPVSTECEIYFERARPKYQCRMQSEKTKPAFARVWSEMFASFVNGPRELYLHSISQLRTIKHMTESMEVEYGGGKYDGEAYLINPDCIIDGFVCAIKDEHSGRFVRGVVTHVEPGKEILIKAVDYGWMFPSIPWKDRHRLKPLRASGQLEATPCAYHCKLRLACQLRQDSYVRGLMRRLVPSGTVWHVIFEDRKVGPPFRVYMYPAYGPKSNTFLKDIFAETYEQEKGMAPSWQVRTTPYLPLGQARNAVKADNRRKERDAMAKEFEDGSEKFKENEIKEGKYMVMVTQIDHLQHFYIQLDKCQTEIVKFGNNLHAFYKHRIEMEKSIPAISPRNVFVGSDVIAKWIDGNYYRGRVVEVIPPHDPKFPKEVQFVRVRYLDYGNVSDYIEARFNLYPLTKIYLNQPISSLCCCLKGFEPDIMKLTDEEQIRYTKAVGPLLCLNGNYRARIEPTDQMIFDRRLHLVTLFDSFGRSINDQAKHHLVSI